MVLRTRRDFVIWNNENDFGYLNEDLDLLLGEETKKILYFTIEDPNLTETEEFATRFVEALVDETIGEDYEKIPKWSSKLGEEDYLFIFLTSWDKERLGDLIGWPLSKEETQRVVLVERRMPGLREYVFFVRG